MTSHEKGRVSTKSGMKPLIGLGIYLAVCAAFLGICCKKFCTCCSGCCCGSGKKEE